MMNSKVILAIACLGVATGLSLTGQAVGADTNNPNPGSVNNVNNNPNENTRTTAQDQALLPAGITSKDLNSDKSIEKTFKDVTEDALDKTGFDNLVGKLVDQDRDRIKKSVTSGSLNNINGSKNTALVNIIGTLQADWKAKYNRSFDIDYKKVFTPEYVHIQTGEVNDPNQLVGKWPVDVMLPSDKPVMNNLRQGAANDNAGKLNQTDANRTASKIAGGDVNLEKGRNVAVAQFQANKYFGGLNASMIHEAGGWKFDVPNTIDAQKLYDNLVNNLTTVEREHAQWPDDIDEAYRHVGAAVIASLYDAPFPGETRPMAPGAAMANP